MIRVVEAVVDEKSRVRLLAKVALPEARRALVTILEEDPKVVAVKLLGSALSEDRSRLEEPQEDEAW